MARDLAGTCALICGLCIAAGVRAQTSATPERALTSAVPPPSALQDWDTAQIMVRRAVWRFYAPSASLGPDSRGRTLARDIDEWVAPADLTAHYRSIRALIEQHSRLGDEATARMVFDAEQAVLIEYVRRLVVVSTYWSQQPVLARSRELWHDWLSQVDPSTAMASQARVDSLQVALVRDYKPTMSVADLTATIDTLKRAYDEERIKLAGIASDARVAAGGVMDSRARSLPCPQVTPADSKASPPESSGADPQPVKVVRAPSMEEFYPNESRLADIHGRAMLRLTIDATGCMVQAELLRSTGAAELDDAAMRIVEYMAFTPAREGGKPVESRPTMPVAFELNKSKVAPSEPTKTSTAHDFIDQGHRLLEARNLDAAIVALDQALAFEPTSAPALTERGTTYYLKKDWSHAQSDLGAAYRIDPRDTSTLYMRGVIAMQLDRPEEAVQSFSALLSLEPLNINALAQRCIAYAALRQWDKSLADANQWVRGQSGAAAPYIARGNAQLSRGQYDLAIADLDRALVLQPKSDVALADRGLVHARQYHDALAHADFEAALSLNPSNVYAYHGRALLAVHANDLPAAEAALGKALELMPDDDYALEQRAAIRTRAGERTLALADADALVRLQPNRDYTYLARARYRPREDRSGRGADIEVALKINPRSAQALSMRAQLQIETGDYAAAIAGLSGALAQADDKAHLLALRGVAYSRSQQSMLAQQDFIAAVTAADSVSDHNNLCYTLAGFDVVLSTALAECNRALTLIPDEAAALDSRAFVLLRLGRLDEAIDGFTDALSQRPNSAASLYGRGIAKRLHGDLQSGDADIQAALAADRSIADTYASYGIKP